MVSTGRFCAHAAPCAAVGCRGPILLTRQSAGRYMAIARFRASRDRPGPDVPKGGEIVAKATTDPALAGIGSIRADLGMILSRSAQRFGSKPALIAGGR